MRMLGATLVAAGMMLAIAGCGGGGGGSSPVGAQLAQAQLNTSYTYDINVSSGRSADTADGRLVITISANGETLSKQGRIDLDDGGRTFSSQIAAYFTQDLSGSLFYAGERNPRDGRTALCASHPLAVRSPMKQGDTWSSSATLEGGATETWRSIVGGLAAISAGGTTYNAYPIETTRQNDRDAVTCTAWYAPEHPVPVRAIGRMDGLVVTISLAGAGRDSGDSGGLDSPPPPPPTGGEDVEDGDGGEIETPPPPPTEWEQQGQNVAAIVGEMLK